MKLKEFLLGDSAPGALSCLSSRRLSAVAGSVAGASEPSFSPFFPLLLSLFACSLFGTPAHAPRRQIIFTTDGQRRL
jgi:hypothetical protein